MLLNVATYHVCPPPLMHVVIDSFQNTAYLNGMSVRSVSSTKTSQVICEEVFDEDSIATHDGEYFNQV